MIHLVKCFGKVKGLIISYFLEAFGLSFVLCRSFGVNVLTFAILARRRFDQAPTLFVIKIQIFKSPRWRTTAILKKTKNRHVFFVCRLYTQ